MWRRFLAPGSLQNMPEHLNRAPMTFLHPASTIPEPMKRPAARYFAFHSHEGLPVHGHAGAIGLHIHG